MKILALSVTLSLSMVLIFYGAPFAAAAVDDGQYAGTDSCMECHEEAYDSYMKNRHAVEADKRTPGAELGCESCHGPGADHAESDGENPILSLSANADEAAGVMSASCLKCHTKGKQVLWHGSEHQNRDLSCSSCHNIHKNYPDNLAQKSQYETCGQCHKKVRSQMLRQSRHPIREGKINCADCHNAHGTVADKLIDAQTISQKCYECHANTRGPFLWEHPPAVEDCLTCHTPHGSSHSGLLKGRAPYLCQRCHSNVGHPSELSARSNSDAGQSAYRVLNNRAFYRACLNCHIAVHGSNHPSGKSLVR